MYMILQYIFATRNALIDGSPVLVAQTNVYATNSTMIDKNVMVHD